MRIAVFDVEANGLLPTKLWCLSYNKAKGVDNIATTTKYEMMKKFLLSADVLVGHNITRWDIPHLERLLSITITAKIVDTLALSWYLEPNRVLHGLDSYGDEFGVPKPKVEDWSEQPIEVYAHRCHEDVAINTLLWEKQWKHLLLLYGSEEEAWRLIDYLSFKMDCAREQERHRWKLDVDRCENVLEKLSKDKEEKIAGLLLTMPKVPVRASKSPPKKMYKKDGSLSSIGMQWQEFLLENNLPDDHNEEVDYIKEQKEPNPNSNPQLKSWLYSLGWEPETFKYDRNKETGDVRKIEQINRPHGAGICPSIKRLYNKEPSLELLDGLSVISHRISILKGFLSAVDEEGYVQAQVQGLTNTLRWKHKVCVNLPGIDKPYGDDIRGCLICPEGYVLVGSDMSSLEDRTKQHYMWDFDKDYVEEMMTDDFDPHLDLCVAGGMLTDGQVRDHKKGIQDHSGARKLGKAANYSCVYGAGGATVARAAGISEREGVKLVEAYWKRNWSVEAIAADQKVKQCRRQKWLYNPVSRLWYSLRAEKDRFSTLNQGTGVWCFDTWVKYQRQKGLPIIGQFHDETINLVKEKNKGKAAEVLRWAIEETNKELKLNRELDIDVQFGINYAAIH
jgi:hypothetical protein